MSISSISSVTLPPPPVSAPVSQQPTPAPAVAPPDPGPPPAIYNTVALANASTLIGANVNITA